MPSIWHRPPGTQHSYLGPEGGGREGRREGEGGREREGGRGREREGGKEGGKDE